MKRIIFSIALLTGFFYANAGNVQAFLSYCTFSSPQDGPYIETYLSVYAKSIAFVKNADGKFQGSVVVTMIFKSGNEIKDVKKTELKSPAVADTNNLDFSFLDQQRILLPNGNYEFEFQIRDVNRNNPPLKETTSLTINYPTDRINVSGIQLVDSYKKVTEAGILTKSGYDFVPYISNFYPKTVNKITFYSEVYGTEKIMGKESKYLSSCYIQASETGQALTDFIKNKKETAKSVNIIFNEFDISKLPSGNYNLVVEVRDQQNQVISFNSVFFQRSNPDVQLEMKDIASLDIRGSFVEKLTKKDSLAEYIRSLAPISSESELYFAERQLAVADLHTMQQYFLNFWARRNANNPGKAWRDYDEQVKIVDQAYRTPIKKGYESDRGRIYLKYGAPNTIADQPFEASNSGMAIGDDQRDGDYGLVPYQIWHYYQLKDNQRDKKFVFANPNIATNDYLLIHSNANGEINNPNWQANLYRTIRTDDKDDIAPKGRYGNKSGDLYNNPR
ncbi:MAG: GWxTD domain-containing protein [Bacteroidetes bacterium]|nr:GWxTD domain-containing protein [Bacteroidota bacterium]